MKTKRFKTGSSLILIPANSQACSIDPLHVSVVINYDLPTVIKEYIYCVLKFPGSRRRKVAINLVTDNKVDELREIEGFLQYEDLGDP